MEASLRVRSVLIVDDNSVFRKIVIELLTRDGDLEICGEAENGREAIEKAQELQPAPVSYTHLTLPTILRV